VDDNGDDKGDREVIVAQGWKPLQHQVDSFGAVARCDGVSTSDWEPSSTRMP
jgi:hypothetical protein